MTKSGRISNYLEELECIHLDQRLPSHHCSLHKLPAIHITKYIFKVILFDEEASHFLTINLYGTSSLGQHISNDIIKAVRMVITATALLTA